jgi:hypothetical protein
MNGSNPPASLLAKHVAEDILYLRVSLGHLKWLDAWWTTRHGLLGSEWTHLAYPKVWKDMFWSSGQWSFALLFHLFPRSPDPTYIAGFEGGKPGGRVVVLRRALHLSAFLPDPSCAPEGGEGIG